MTGARSGGTSLLLLLLGIGVGALLIGAVRFVGQPTEHPTHYHANWAIFIDGERLDLSANRYMEDVFQCMANPDSQSPEDRVHMHEGNPDVVHVHAAGVAWGHLLANLGFGIGDDYLFTDRGRYPNEGERRLTFVLNGERISSIRNRPIGDRDRLLISYGSEPLELLLTEQFPHVANDAGRFNELPDPASCSGPAEEGLGSRLRRSFWY